MSWINCKKSPFYYNTNITPNHIFFLYSFLGDSYNINNEEYIENLQKWALLLENTKWKISILRRNYDLLDKIVKDHFNWFWITYNKYPKNIQRCDTLRYMLMYKYGGVYSDLDVLPNISINTLLDKYHWANIIFGVGRIKSDDKCKHTTKYEKIRNSVPEIPIRISNYFFISRIPYHPIWIDILKLCSKRADCKLTSQYGIIYTTGPDVVTTAVSNNRIKYSDIAIIPHKEFTKMYHHSCSGFNSKTSWRYRTKLPISSNGSKTI